MLSCRGLRKDYVTERGEVAAVAGVDLDVAKGRYAAIIGRSGSGKSSLMAMIGGLSRPSHGQVMVDGTDIWSLSENDLAAFRNKRIGYVFQFASLLPTLRLVDNVALPAMLGGGLRPLPLTRGRRRCWARWAWAIISMPIRRRSRPVSSGAR